MKDEDDSTNGSGSESETEFVRPVFVPKNARGNARKTFAEAETIRIAEERKAQERVKREQLHEADLRIAQDLQREAQLAEGVDLDLQALADDRDGEDPNLELEMWKIRELKRLKRDLELKQEREREEAELEQRRMRTDKQAMRDLREEEAETHRLSKPKFEKGYWHRGAFYQNDDAEVLKRDFDAM